LGWAFGFARLGKEGQSGGKAPHSKTLPAPLQGGESLLAGRGLCRPWRQQLLHLLQQRLVRGGRARRHGAAQHPVEVVGLHARQPRPQPPLGLAQALLPRGRLLDAGPQRGQRRRLQARQGRQRLLPDGQPPQLGRAQALLLLHLGQQRLAAAGQHHQLQAARPELARGQQQALVQRPEQLLEAAQLDLLPGAAGAGSAGRPGGAGQQHDDQRGTQPGQGRNGHGRPPLQS
jgi:hypothetical protein